ncbi:MAG TPA: PBP1A family penicillin-binding protein [Thermoanaerobaculia bacterium]
MQRPTFLQRPRRTFPEMDPARRRLVIAGLVVSALLFLGGFFTAGYLWSLARQFPRAPFQQPSRLYAQPTLLVPGEAFSLAEAKALLRQTGYREATGDPKLPLRPGSFRASGDRLAVHLRRFPTPDGQGGGMPVEVAFRGSRVARVWAAGQPRESVTLEPALLASFYTPEVEERRPVLLDDAPEHLVKAVLAAEDDGFFTHPGVSPTGVMRALWVNARGGEMHQGGSTITQQLVKNVYLSPRRTLTRKAKEAVIAMAVELRYGKEAILEAYMNEIYLGRSGPANLIGFGAAARAFFGKEASELSLEEAATLAGMIQAPAAYDPVDHPDKARERRDWVLRRMRELDWISEERLQRALAEPVRLDPVRVEARPMAPYFAGVAEDEARERFGVDKLAGEGYLLFSTLRWRDQRQAEKAVANGLAGLEKGWERKRRGKGPLQSALVSVDPREGSVLAWVGGRDYATSQFDRVSQARRQAGSAFKPVVYAAAFAEGVATPASLFKDSPINVRVGTSSWRPQNYDRTFHGWVTARQALEQSLNIPTVRLSLQVGMPRIIELARDLGIEGEIDPVPAMSLGAFEMTPLEMAGTYATLAAGGIRPPVHSLAAVIDPEGEPVLGDDLPSPRRVVPQHAAWLVTSVLQGVVEHGTGAAARVQGHLAGKTGTTNDRRDSWFAGYSPDRVTVVWVGYDDNSPTSLSGARAALPIWSRFTSAVRPAAGYPAFVPPPGMVLATVDPLTGQLATPYCPHQATEYFPEWQAPVEPCRRHMPGYQPDVYADVTLGEAYDTYGAYGSYESERPRYVVTDDGLEIVYPDEGDSRGGAGEAMTFPPSGGADEGEEPAEDGSIIIRPARERSPAMPPVASPPPPPPVSIAAPTPSVVSPAAGQPIGDTGPPPSPPPADAGPPPPM